MRDNEQAHFTEDDIDIAKQIFRQAAVSKPTTQPLSVQVLDALELDKTEPRRPKRKVATTVSSTEVRLLQRVKEGETLQLCGLLGHVVRDKRKAAGLSRKELAQITGIKVSWLERLERGFLEVNKVNSQALHRIADALQMSIISLQILAQVGDDSLSDAISKLEPE